MVQQVLGNVAEDYFAALSYLFQRAKCYQAVACAHIQQRTALGKPGIAQHLVAHRIK